MGTVRSLEPADLPALARLFSKVFRRRPDAPTVMLQTYLAALYLPAPDSAGGIESKVFVTDDDTVAGFCGVSEQPMRIGERTIRAAACSSLMVDPELADAMAAGRLMRSIRQGAQDFTFSETASAASVTMWKGLRGTVLQLHSLDWLRVFEPLQFALSLGRQRLPGLGLLAPVLAPFDTILRRSASTPGGWRLEPDANAASFGYRDIDRAETAALVRQFAAQSALAPTWPNDTLERRIEDASHKSMLGPMTGIAVTNADGRTIGVFIYHGQRGRVGRVLQFLALPNQSGVVLDRMFAHAHSQGLVGLRGRSDPALLDAARDRHLIFTSRASTVVDSRDPDVLSALASGNVMLHGLAGETWSRLNYDELI